jgi:putative transposase
MAPVRFVDSTHLRLPKLGEVRIKGCARKVARMIASGRLHVHSATVSHQAGRWYVSVNGVAGEFHHQRRSHSRRQTAAVGADRGLKTQAVSADTTGRPFMEWEGVKALRRAEAQLRRANQAFSRTKKGSARRAKARARLAKLHVRIVRQRSHVAHQASHDLATLTRVVCIEDLNIAGMAKNRSLAKSVADAAMGELGRRLGYKAAWYGAELHLADRWYASSKTCSGCGNVKDKLYLHERVYVCDRCGMEIDRDLNAAVTLARWPARQEQQQSPPLEAAA